MDSKVFKIIVTFEKPHPVLLSFSENGLYLISKLCNTYLGFSKDYKLCETS